MRLWEPKKRFRIAQTSEHRANDVWDWEMWIETAGSAGNLADIRAVTYGLHPAFPNPNRVIRSRERGFRLCVLSAVPQNETWGRFEVRVTIALANGKREVHTVMLDLLFPDTRPAPELLPLPANADYKLTVRYFNFLKRKSAFGYARDVLDHAAKLLQNDPRYGSEPSWGSGQQFWIEQQRALCTYKDPSLPADTRLQDALAILQKQCGLNLQTCNDPETLGLGGAIHKRLWEVDRSRSNLELALAHYRRGYRLMLDRGQQPNAAADPRYDAGAFTGANIMYLCDVLALETSKDVDPKIRRAWLAEGANVRRQLLRNLPGLLVSRPNDWWLAATMLDVYFVLGCRHSRHRSHALQQAMRIAKIEADPWERQSTGSQLLRSARLQKQLCRGSTSDIDALLTKVVTTAFGGKVNVAHQWLDGKLGLALSGGGFRASLFHIGVLARMAELDLLRHVEVISCVSGGSIVGAHYYLLLRKLLQAMPDNAKLDRQQYIDLIKQLLEQFLLGVQKNLRMYVAASWIANVRMIFQPSRYSRTQRLGRLYEKYLYRQVPDDEERTTRWLDEAFIIPKSEDGEYEDAFSPKLDNWRRSAKVPMLVLNATTLNTGRNWQFTASFMGEPQSYGTTVDSTERLDAVYFSEAPEKWRQYRLGDAVAASSCVPGLFTPIVIPNLFRGRTVRLVDGGVHDNQGVRALLDQDCDAIIVSDASGQMDSLPNPSPGELGVLLRTNSVLQARIRVAQHQELQARMRASLLRHCVFLHLRKNLEGSLQKAAEHATGMAGEDPAVAPAPVTDYGIHREVQRALSSLRTDLDSFTDREALTLMYSGYKMAEKHLDGFPGVDIGHHVSWRFHDVAGAASGNDQPDLAASSLLRHLNAGSRLALKVWRLHPVLDAVRIAFLVLLAGTVLTGLGWLVYNEVHIRLDQLALLKDRSIDLGAVAKGILLASAAALIGTLLPIAKVYRDKVPLTLNAGAIAGRIGFGLGMATVGWLLCRLHLWLFDRIYLRLGRVRRTTS